jgi:uncharacterized protein with HEPN domain
MRRDDAYLLDILIAARRAIRCLEGLTRAEFEPSDLNQNAVMRPLEIIGQADRLVSQDLREAHPDIPWEQMVGMRNRLIHEYFRVSLTVQWDTVRDDLPRLVSLVAPLVPSEDAI